MRLRLFSLLLALVSAPPIRPQARIFWDSRADWSCSAGELPTHSEYPA